MERENGARSFVRSGATDRSGTIFPFVEIGWNVVPPQCVLACRPLSLPVYSLGCESGSISKLRFQKDNFEN